MNSRKFWLMWAVLLTLLTGCVEEFHGEVSFEKNGSGVLSLKVMHSKDSKAKNIESCRQYFTGIKWKDISYKDLSSINNLAGDQCTYIYSFNDLDEVESVHKTLGFKLGRLTIDENNFTYKAANKTCTDDFDPKVVKSATWSVRPPGTISSHNAEKIIGDKLTWTLSGSDCYNISAMSTLTQPPEKVTENPTLSKVSPSEKTESQPFDTSIVTWTTVGASLATIIATAIAYKESKKKK